MPEDEFSLPSVVGAPVIIAVELDPVNVVVCGTVPECTSDEETIYKLGFGVDLLQCTIAQLIRKRNINIANML